MCAKKFLSTPSARRATIISSIIVLPLSISIHALREEGDIVHGIGESLSFISIHALREEGDRRRLEVARHEAISIHALREEGDKSVRVAPHRNGDFYPRPPRGGRQAAAAQGHEFLKFLSTPSARRATPVALNVRLKASNFYPRPPRGGRHGSPIVWIVADKFLSTPSARRATRGESR